MNILNHNNIQTVNPQYIEDVKHLSNIVADTIILDFNDIDAIESHWHSVKSVFVGWGWEKETSGKNVIVWDSLGFTTLSNWIKRR